VGLLVVGLLAGGGYAAYRGLKGKSSGGAAARTTLARCPKPTANPLFAPARQVHLAVYNASLRTGLAATVEQAMKRRGFHVSQIGNASKVGHDIATIRYSADQARGYRTVAAQIQGATGQPVAGQHVLELDLGVHFNQLRSAAAARTAEQRQATATPSASPSASPTATCRPRP
jgi:acetolactate synthase regulatory subunit